MRSKAARIFWILPKQPVHGRRTDGRGVIVELMEKGRKLVEPANARPRRNRTASYRDAEPEERRSIAAGLRRMMLGNR
jgi:DNA-binding MarR family transcriptional regulator